MNNNYLLHDAIVFAAIAHNCQDDKGGLPYILHPIAVMQSVETLDEKVVAILHDVVEDCPNVQFFSDTHQLVHDEEYSLFLPEEIFDAVIAITKVKGEKYTDYLTRVKNNPLALKVKLADIAHNTSHDRMAVLSESERDYLTNKYKKALEFLKS